MTTKSEILLEGSYLYFQKDVNFCQESFQVYQLIELSQIHVHSEISSRVETGEFLKVIVRYEMTNHFIPIGVKIEKSIGSKHVIETFKYDQHAQELHYTFKSGDTLQEITRPHSSKHYLTSPSFATSAMFTLSKKMDATGRTAVILVSSGNDWEFTAPPVDKIIFTEFKSRELDDYRLNNTPLTASQLCLYENDSSFASANEQPANIFISKHYAVPYQLVHGDMKINIQNLKKHS